MKCGLFLAMVVFGCGDDGTATTESTGSTSTDPTSSSTVPGTSTSSPSTSSTDASSSSDTTSPSSSTQSESASTSTGEGSSSSSSGGSTGCEPATVDGSAIGQDCMKAPCPDGYDCIDHGGVQLQQLCGILCEEDCNCPEGLSCTEFNIKGVTHYECR